MHKFIKTILYYDDPPNEEDDEPGEITYTESLLDEFTTEMLLDMAISDRSDF
jgi:hypothetical protein